MKPSQIILIIFIGAFLSNCRHGNNVSNTGTDSSKKAIETQDRKIAVKEDAAMKDSLISLDLKYGFRIKAGKAQNFGNFNTYQYLEVWHNSIKLFTDTAEEYEFDEKYYPILNQLKPDVFELLIGFNNRPSKDLVTFLRIENDKIVKMEQLPTFDTKPEKINGLLTYHTIWDNGEMWDENGKRYTTYNPELYYKFTADGIKLDTALTILKSKQKYGRFDGLTYKGTIGYPCDDRGNITDTTAKNVLRKPDDY